MDYNRLSDLINKGISSRKIAKELNCSQSNINYWIKKYNLTVTKKEIKCLNCDQKLNRSIRKYCSNECQHQFQLQNLIKSKNYSAKTAKRYLFKNDPNCAVCRISTWNDKPIGLELDHIDGNANNNSLENLRLICPNCHSQTTTYKNKNKGSGRFTRMKRYHSGKSY